MSQREEILKMLEPMFQEAIREKKWFYCGYQAMVFSPKELREEHNKDQLIWGPTNWRLIDPPKPTDIDRLIMETKKKNDALIKRIEEGWKLRATKSDKPEESGDLPSSES